jgi:hypothetical protein
MEKEGNKIKSNTAIWLSLGVVFWLVFKSPIYSLIFTAIGFCLNKKNNKNKDNNG